MLFPEILTDFTERLQQNKMAVNQKILKRTLDDVSGHVVCTERKHSNLVWIKNLNYTNKTSFYFQSSKLIYVRPMTR